MADLFNLPKKWTDFATLTDPAQIAEAKAKNPFGLTPEDLLRTIIEFADDEDVQKSMVRYSIRDAMDDNSNRRGPSYTILFDRSIYNLIGETYIHDWADRILKF
jgi:hypothetical protein